jgi:hypothetical protein
MLHFVGNISKGIYLQGTDPWTLNVEFEMVYNVGGYIPQT